MHFGGLMICCGMGKVRSVSKGSFRREEASNSVSVSNRQLAELLALEGEKAEGYVRKAFFRAAHAAFLWPVEASAIVKENRSLTELPSIGPFLAKILLKWIESPPAEMPTPPEVRRNFLSLAEGNQVLDRNGRWREKLKGDLQMHTRWSDGSGSIREMAEAGLGRGYEYLSITDHTKGLKIAGGIDEKELEEQAEEIREVNEGLKAEGKEFRVLRSVELNLSPTGEGDMDCDCLNGMDIVLGSFHSQLRKTTDQTERYIAALENPCLHILGHPRGRVYNYRVGLSAEWRRVFARAAELDKAVEVDAYSDRQDLDVELLQIAREEGVRISFGSDSHHPWQLIFLDLALASSLLAGIPEDRILNFMPVEKLLDWVQSHRH
jgi:histidinol phosphatase-like PHP family hydrolase